MNNYIQPLNQQLNSYMSQAMANVSGLSAYLEQFAALMLGVTIAEVVLDFFFNQKRSYKETFVNVGIGVIHDLLSNTLANAVVLIGLVMFVPLSPIQLPINLWTMVLAIFIADFLYYWNHRAEHRIRLFWAYHSVHHSSTDFNLTVALRLAWVEDFILWIFYIPLVLIGFHPLQTLIAISIVGLYQVWIHNQKIGRLGILEEILNTPSNHRVHHGSNPKYIDKNYGGILIIWDKLFGTYQAETEKVIYGLTEKVNTCNLIKLNFMEYSRILSYVQQSRNRKEFFWSIFGPPEWKPQKVNQFTSEESPL
ncbi:MAG: sterol desaturase family protein [Scytonematopsis contorta HA4267-MV1]|jgi:sterol desaturase/sphingolipid hydroxylase (fatty acid hydroxylase superfamily)|nr:sterol desaturase family protein [Scytonematopsis contorta HA4267-MV1]